MRATKPMTASIILVLTILSIVCLPSSLVKAMNPRVCEFSPLDDEVSSQCFVYGTSADEISAQLPKTLKGILDGNIEKEIVVESWTTSASFDAEVRGPYQFVANITENTLAAGLKAPEITIYLLNPLQLEINHAMGTKDNPTKIYLDGSLELDELIVVADYKGPGTEPGEDRHVEIIGDGHALNRADSYIADEERNNILIALAGESTLGLQDIEISGKIGKNQSALLWVAEDSKLEIGDGTLLHENGNSAIINRGYSELLSGAVIEKCQADYGGGVFNEQSGTLTINDGSIIRNCGNDPEDISGGAIYSSGYVNMSGGLIENCTSKLGGAIANSGTLTMENARIANCEAINGGAIFNTPAVDANMDFVPSSAYITTCEFENNKAEGSGGAIFVDYNTNLSVKDSLFMENSARDNGGALFSSGVLVLKDNHFQKNEAGGIGGGAAIADTQDDYQYIEPEKYPVPHFELVGDTFTNNLAGWHGGGLGILSNWESGDTREPITGSIEGVTFSGNTSGNELSGDVYQYANEYGGVKVNVKDTIADKVLLSKDLEAAESTWTAGSGVKIGGNSLTLAQGQPLLIASALTQNISIKSQFASQDTINSEVVLTAFKVGDVLVQAAQGYTLTQADIDHIVTDVPLELKDGKIVVAQKINPTPTPTPVPSPTPKPVPSTGDQTPINILFVLAGVSLCLVAVMLILRRRKI